MVLDFNDYFYLHTQNSSYVIRILPDNTLCHCYYGKRIKESEIDWHNLFIPHDLTVPCNIGEDSYSRDALPQESPGFGKGDYRPVAFSIEGSNGRSINDFKYRRHRRYSGIKKPLGLPCLDKNTENAETLEIVMDDSITGVELKLFYTVFEESDVIARYSVINNRTSDTVKLKSVSSMCLDFEDCDFDAITMYGSWTRERSIERYGLRHGDISVSSLRGASGHHSNPFMALARKDANEDFGEVYGVSLIYSGDFDIRVNVGQFDTVRMLAGINPDTFEWQLKSGESFTSPQAILTYSPNGISGMSHNFHTVCRNHLGACTYDVKHPVVLNLWEAFYFRVDENKVISAINSIEDTQIDTLVIDDGWFGERNDDKTSLGDWFINKEKFPNGFETVIKECKKNGFKFGIWIEPEMISRNSKLCIQHPDWFISAPGTEPTESRNELVLDLCRQEVIDGVYDIISNLLNNYDISYVKWDMNRNITDNGSKYLVNECQGEHSYRYMLGVYQLMDRITTAFPNVFFEGCAGGGGRFDFGILYYMPQIWASDNSDAAERLKIQYGTSLVYPPETMSAHVSVCPNHQTGRTTPFDTRANVAQFFSFGYEFDPSLLTDEEKNEINAQVQLHKRIEGIGTHSLFYRLKSPYDNNYGAWQIVSKDKKKSFVMYTVQLMQPNFSGHYLRVKGLKEDAQYHVEPLNINSFGDALMNCGLPIKSQKNDFDSVLFEITQL